MSYSYGSDLRDKAIVLETLVLLGERAKAFELLKEISKGLSNAEYWMSTQTISWCLKAAGAFASPDQKDELKFSYSIDGKESTASTGLPLAQVNIPIAGTSAAKVNITNTSKAVAFVRIIAEGTPARGEEVELENNLTMTVKYTDSNGNLIDPATLEQGAEFTCNVTVTNPGIRGLYKNLALHQIFPSGWEINNLRLTDDVAARSGDIPTYQDIRDDRVYTYFDLGANQQKTFTVQLTASYAGVFYLPAVSCEAMYDRSIYSTKKGKEVSVIKKVNQ